MMTSIRHFPHEEDDRSEIEIMTDSDISINEPSMLGEGTSYTSSESQQPVDGPSIHDRLLSLASLASSLKDSNRLPPENEEQLHCNLDKIEAELQYLNGDASSLSRTPTNFQETVMPLTINRGKPADNVKPTEPSKETRQVTEDSTALSFRQVDQEYYISVLNDLENLTTELEKRRDECIQIKTAAEDRQNEFLRELSIREEKILSL